MIYVSAVAGQGKFDLVVIDGERRVQCAEPASDALTSGGVIIWDNSEETKYRPGYEILVHRGFRQLDLWGLAPGINHWGSTAIFYRDGNCLGS